MTSTPILADRLRGVVNVNARFKPEVRRGRAHEFSVFVADAATPDVARRLHGWAQVEADHAAVSVVNGSLLCLAIARAFVAGAT